MKRILLLCALVTTVSSGCTYDSIRLHERQNCGAMVQSESQRCYARTQDTKAEYDAKRSKLKQSPNSTEKKPVDPRYEQWIP